jgi:hypothetical protein
MPRSKLTKMIQCEENSLLVCFHCPYQNHQTEKHTHFKQNCPYQNHQTEKHTHLKK